ncbi:MAG: hypothetical protein JWM34_3539 [Ilumatobacteraceae bacterium]|nr:hypothetical protein [Ilumatobacteraceae bacterium]
MKTRTLLLLAVSCGLVILIAGSIKVFLIADDSTPAHLAIGQRAQVGDMHVTVTGSQHSAGQTIVDVTIGGVDDSDGATTFFYGVGGTKELRPVSPGGSAGSTCEATHQSTDVRCVLAFDTSAPGGVLRYERAGATPARWDIVSS